MTEEPIREQSQAVQAHLSILQSIIERMATNSASAKAWCIALVSAVLVIVADKGKPQFIWLALVPTLLFCILDAYYLGLEKEFRDAYNAFIDKLHSREVQSTDLYVVQPKGSQVILSAKSLLSFSIWPFYVTLIGMIYLSRLYVM